MAGVQIFTKSPINPAVQAPGAAGVTNVSSPANHREPQPVSASSSPSSSTYNASQTIPAGPLSSTSWTVKPVISPRPGPNSKSTYTPQTASAAAEHSSSVLFSSPPRPRHLPSPMPSKSRSPSPARHIPPPPKVGEKMQPASYYSPTPTPTQVFQPPYQIGTNLVSDKGPGADAWASNTLHTRSNDLLSPYSNGLIAPQESYKEPTQTPTTAGASRQSLEHPPGYVQNPYAADMTPEQRFTTQHGVNSLTLGYNDNSTGIGGSKTPTGAFSGMSGTVGPSASGSGILDGNGNDNDRNVLTVAGGWLKVAGKKMSEVEGEVWRRINGE